jgi:copper chaperone NosL
MLPNPLLTVLLLCLLGGTACQPGGPEAIRFGQDQCIYCRMTIADPRFGAELITDKGRVLKYDAAECMIHHLASDAPPHRALFAIAYDTPRELYPVDSLVYVLSPTFKSPMGANLAGLRYSGERRDSTLRWEAVTQILAE